MTGLMVFAGYSSDGLDDMCVCDGMHHRRVYMPDWGDDEPHAGAAEPCDGTCRDRDWKSHILEQIEKVRGAKLHTGEIVEQEDGSIATTGPVLESHVEITAEAQEILDQSEIIGVRIYDWYAKRCGDGETYRLADGRYLVLTTDYNWWSCDNTGRFRTIKVTVERPDEDSGMHWREYVLKDHKTTQLVTQALATLA